ncbi:hypothetical protein [Simplicispira lacusdiani]|uniref:hypothetical protein n=1 Tax=Simplicispira lacusdiani TaxID=2213010 RepID=UPI001E359B85|nr:hypothetical protein [Simplicispira lacusdiani]
MTAQDVAFVPVIDGDLTLAAATTELTTMGASSLTGVAGAATKAAGLTATPVFSMRYFIDGVVNSGNDTRIVVWSTGDQRGTHTVNAYDDAQNRKSVNFKLSFAELDWFDPETIPGMPAGHKDGFIEWNPGLEIPADYSGAAGQSLFTLGGAIFTYSLISAPAFGAVQTVLGAHR